MRTFISVLNMQATEYTCQNISHKGHTVFEQLQQVATRNPVTLNSPRNHQQASNEITPL